MKKITTTLILIIGAIAILAQSPQAFKYQAVVRNNAGEILANQLVSFRMSIRDQTPGGTIEFQDLHGIITNEFGVANLEIGNGAHVFGNFNSIDWGNGPKYLEVELDVAGGGNYISIGTSQLLSTPYALHARTSEDAVWNQNGSDIYYNDGRVGIGTTNPAYKLDVYGNRIRLYENSSGDWLALRTDGGALDFQFEGGNLYFQSTVPDEHILLNPNSGNNVGIGTTSPSEKLDVNGGIKLGSTTNTNAGTVRWSGGDFEGYDGNDWLSLTTGGGSSVWNQIGSDIYYNSGNIGVGLTNPNRKLYIRHNFEGLSYPLKIENKTGGPNVSAAGILFSSGVAGDNERGKGGLVYEYTSTWNRGDFHFLQNNSDNEDNPDISDAVFTIKNNGNVGIGITSPSTRLEVSSLTDNPTMILHRATGQPSIKSNEGHLMLESNGNAVGLNWYGADDVILVNGGGKVGIGTSSPSTKLDVSGATGISVTSMSNGVSVNSAGDDGVYVYHAGNPSAQYISSNNNGFEVAGAEEDGLYVGYAGDDGIHVYQTADDAVYIDEAGDDGVHVSSAGNNGVGVGSADNNGVYVGSADYKGISVINAGQDGVYVYDAGDVGVHNYSSYNNGFEVAGAEEYGLYVGYAGFMGIFVHTADDYGIYIREAGGIGVYANTTDANDEYGIYTPDKMYAYDGYYPAKSGTFGKNTCTSTLEPGDLVCISGGYEENVLGEDGVPVVNIEKANAGNSQSVFGVVEYKVYIREDAEELEEGKTEIQKSFRHSDGDVMSGDYLAIIVFGPADVKVNRSADIKTGEKLTVAENGIARSINDEDNWRIGILGKALENSNGKGTIKVYVNCR